MNFLRSQRPALRLLLACGMERASEINKAIVCSAVVIVLPSGAFITTTPRMVAAETSILSTPTPARPITRNVFAASRSSAVTFVSLRTIRPSQSFKASRNSGGASPDRFSTLKPAERNGSNPLSLTSSATKIFIVIVLPVKNGYGNSAAVGPQRGRKEFSPQRGTKGTKRHSQGQWIEKHKVMS